ncbi:hypothetical protein GBAR_LOCUS18319, partial [Geodia barretti]
MYIRQLIFTGSEWLCNEWNNLIGLLMDVCNHCRIVQVACWVVPMYSVPMGKRCIIFFVRFFDLQKDSKDIGRRVDLSPVASRNKDSAEQTSVQAPRSVCRTLFKRSMSLNVDIGCKRQCDEDQNDTSAKRNKDVVHAYCRKW